MPDQSTEEPLGTSPDSVAVPVTDPKPELTGGASEEWQGGLYKRVINAIFALPNHFRSSLDINGIRATDLYTLNTALGAAIEQSVVDNLNAIRTVWDPDGKFQSYAFVRQAQAFPDVRLQTDSPTLTPQILMGIELKGWFALSKEGEPSFRYLVTPGACAEADLLVVFPWILDEIVSGAPRLLKPFVTEARYAALQRNYYWQVMRGASGDNAAIETAVHRQPYPIKADQANDSAVKDSGNNFGRVARSGLMGDFIAELMKVPTAGIPLGAWQGFIKIFSDSYTEAKVTSGLKQLRRTYQGQFSGNSEAQLLFDSLIENIQAFVRAIE